MVGGGSGSRRYTSCDILLW